MTNPDDLKQRLRASYGTSCYLCGAQRPKLDDVLVLLFNPIRDTVETEDNTYLCCKSCAPRYGTAPLVPMLPNSGRVPWPKPRGWRR